jgi:Rod binding domain-containing protein
MKWYQAGSIVMTLIMCSQAAGAKQSSFTRGNMGAAEIYKDKVLVDKIKENSELGKYELDDKQYEKEAGRVAKELQDVLAYQLLKAMNEGIKPNSLTGGGSAEEMYTSLLNEERAKVIDLGLADPIKDQIMSVRQGVKRHEGTREARARRK